MRQQQNPQHCRFRFVHYRANFFSPSRQEKVQLDHESVLRSILKRNNRAQCDKPIYTYTDLIDNLLKHHHKILVTAVCTK